MRKLGLRAVIAGASVLTIMSAVDGADLLGQAHADPRCATSGADPCQPQADPPPQADPRWGLSALAGGRRPEELTAGKCQHPASTCSPDSAAELLRKHGIPLPTNDFHLRRRLTSRWLSPHRGAAWLSSSD
jgi:hypothetical protein